MSILDDDLEDKLNERSRGVELLEQIKRLFAEDRLEELQYILNNKIRFIKKYKWYFNHSRTSVIYGQGILDYVCFFRFNQNTNKLNLVLSPYNIDNIGATKIRDKQEFESIETKLLSHFGGALQKVEGITRTVYEYT